MRLFLLLAGPLGLRARHRGSAFRRVESEGEEETKPNFEILTEPK